MADNLGFDPTKRNLTLSWKADFVQQIEPETVTYPEGTVARIEIYADETGEILITITAELSAGLDLLTFFRDSADVNDIPDESPYHMYQSYPFGSETADFVRYYGIINRKEAANGAL